MAINETKSPADVLAADTKSGISDVQSTAETEKHTDSIFKHKIKTNIRYN